MRSGGQTRIGGIVAAGLAGLLAVATLATAGLVAAQPPAATVTGTITTKDPVTLASGSVAHVLLIDRSARGGAAVVAGVRRFPAGTGTPVRFSVAYDRAAIDPGHAYVAFAALADGSRRRQSTDGVPVITGGPTDGVEVRVRSVSPLDGVVTARLVRADKGTLSAKAVAWAALLDTESGRIVGWTFAAAPETGPAEVAIGFDPTLVDPSAPLAVWAAITDGTRVRESGALVPVTLATDGSATDAGTIALAGPRAVPAVPPPPPTPAPVPVAIPEVRDLPAADARTTLTAAGVVPSGTTKLFSGAVAAGNALKTDPAAGTFVAPGSDVQLFVSKGPKPTPTPTPAVTPTPKPTAKPTAKPTPTAAPATTPSPTPPPVKIPTLRGVPEADAIVRLQDRGLLAGARERRANANVATGAVIRTEPEEGTKVRPGTKVDLYISTGPAPTPTPTPRPVTVPDVRGLEEADALIVLGDAGFTIGERIRVPDALVPAGRVVSTRPAARSQVPAGTRIEVRVSTGPEPTPVPPPTPTPAPTPGPSPVVPVLDGYLSGTLVVAEPAPAGPAREVIVTLVEETATGSRVVPGRVFVADGSAPAAFVLSYPAAEIDPTATYRVYAAIVDGPDAWVSAAGTPAITGGAGIAGLVVPLTLRTELLEGEVTGAIVGPPPGLPATAVRETFLVRSDTGEIVGYDAGTVDGRTVLPFAVAFLVDTLDPAAPYTVVARVTDGTRIWTGPGVPVVTNGAPFRVVVPVAEVLPGEIPLSAP